MYLLLLSGCSALFAAAPELKRVMILDFKNILKKKEFGYLESSITDAVRQKLKAKFAYEEINRTRWLDVANQNYIIEDDLFTYSAAMNLGLLSKQDVVIFGGYVVESKGGSANPEIRTRVRILDLAKRKEIADFEMKSLVDATIFDSVEKIAERIEKEAAAVLPNADDWAKGAIKPEVPTFNQLSLRSQFAPISLSTAGRSISPDNQYAGAAYKNVIGGGLDFQHFGIRWQQLGIFAGGFVRVANDQFVYSLDKSAAQTTLLSLAGNAGISWRQSLSDRFYLQPMLGGGVQYDIMKFNFESRTIAVATSAGQQVNQAEYQLLAPFALAGMRIGYAWNSWLSIEAGAQYALYVFSGGTNQALFAEIGVGFRL